MKITKIDNAKAPEPPVKRKPNLLADTSREALSGLEPGKTTIIELDEGQKPRGVKTSLSRIAGKMNIPVSVWDDGGKVYVRQAD